ncbi:MAG: hypothetical protein KKG99_17070 [Bacteroidetes bacterium]|nr:hypothetical protein [Bacteroidota bacterium]
MKPLKESEVIVMDGSDMKLYPFLPFILQDIWKIGADPDAIIISISKHFDNVSGLKVFDLGCGKGAVSILRPKVCVIKKIHKVDYPRGRAKGYLPAASRFRQLYFSKMLKTEFSLFHPSVSLSTDIPA